MPEDPLTRVRVVVLTHDPGPRSGDLAGRVVGAGVAPEHVVVVFNPPSQDLPAPAVPDPAIAVLRTPRNIGYTGGMNLGIRHHLERDAEWILVLTHDVRFEDGALRELATAGAAHPEYGVLGPELFDPVRGVMFSYGARMTSTGGLWHRTEPPADEVDGIVGADSVDGAFVLFRADALRRAGLFDDKLFMYVEESELSWRIAQAGWKVGVVRAARGEQSVGAPARPGAYGYLMTRNGLNLARQAKGVPGVVGGLGRAAVQVAVHGRRVLDPRRPAEAKVAPRAQAAGVVRGALAYFRGEWGAPPDSLPGMGDMRGA